MITIDHPLGQDFEVVRERLLTASRVVLITGAGISQSSGVMDFRSTDGLFHKTVRDILCDLNQKAIAAVVQESTASMQDDEVLEGIDRTTQNQSGHTLFEGSAMSQPGTQVALFRMCALLRKLVRILGEPSKMHQLLDSIRREGRLLHWYTQNIDGFEALTGARVFDPTQPIESKQVKSNEGLRRFDVIQVHGSVDVVWCNKGSHKVKVDDDIEHAFLRGEPISCAQCPTMSSFGREIGPSYFRPGILLYNDPHQCKEELSEFNIWVLKTDLSRKPDLMLIAGTSLRIPGMKAIVKRLAKAIDKRRKTKDLKCNIIMVDLTPPPEDLRDLIDIFVRMDCDYFADRIEARKEAALYKKQYEGETQFQKGDMNGVDDETLSLLMM